MKVSYVLIAVVLVIVGIYFVSQRSGAMEITQRGNDPSVDRCTPHRSDEGKRGTPDGRESVNGEVDELR